MRATLLGLSSMMAHPSGMYAAAVDSAVSRAADTDAAIIAKDRELIGDRPAPIHAPPWRVRR